MNERPKQVRLLTIGALARATGVPAETLRTWERRYGFPSAERTSTGHRRYTVATLERLRLVRAAVRMGHRASVALSADDSELHALLSDAEYVTEAPVLRERATDAAAVTRWIELIRRFDGRTFERELRSALATLGAQRFLAQRIGPLLHQIGERWSNSEVGVRHEHFASERLHEFLTRHWQPLSDGASGPSAVCATLPGERHALGLQMAALTLALNNLRVVYLGADVPAAEIAAAVTQHAARAVVLSSALGSERERSHAECAALRETLGPGFAIVVGGAGFDDAPQTVRRLDSLSALDAWARDLALEAAPN
jgi:MerR family transcriptional regulator, light-induced transcriptional regulator